MKIAYISDLHLEFRPQTAIPLLEGKFNRLTELGFPHTIDADVIVLAGDIHPNLAFRRVLNRGLSETYGLPVVSVDGNHDYYGRDFPTGTTGLLTEIDGVRFAVATLWTHVNPLLAASVHQFADFKHIHNINAQTWNQTHAMQLDFLMKSGADVIVTHHAPTHGSRHPRFSGNRFNDLYTNNLDIGAFEGLKLWVHGHVHDEWDYIEQGVRVVCNPLGYPFELHRRGAQIKIVEI